MTDSKFVKFKKKHEEGEFYIRKDSMVAVFKERDYVRLVTVSGDFFTSEELNEVLRKVEYTND